MNKRLLAAYVVIALTSAVVVTSVFAVIFTAAGPLSWLGILAGIAASGIILSAVIVTCVHVLIVKPADMLTDGMKRVTSGNFDVSLDEQKGHAFRSAFADFNEMAASLLQVEALRESFVSNVAHEFKTPLSYIQGYSTLLQDEDLTPEERREYVSHVNNATRRLSDMIGNLLEISSLSRPYAAVEMERFSLDEQLRHVMAVLLPQMNRKGVNYEIGLERVDIMGNESLLEDAWTNLISNAVKFTQPGGTVTVELKAGSKSVTVTVADTGCGMSEEQVAHAFDRFYQGDEAHAGEGNGLGLAIVRAVVKKHNGLVSVQSEIDAGTTFTVTLPMK